MTNTDEKSTRSPLWAQHIIFILDVPILNVDTLNATRPLAEVSDTTIRLEKNYQRWSNLILSSSQSQPEEADTSTVERNGLRYSIKPPIKKRNSTVYKLASTAENIVTRGWWTHSILSVNVHEDALIFYEWRRNIHSGDNIVNENGTKCQSYKYIGKT